MSLKHLFRLLCHLRPLPLLFAQLSAPKTSLFPCAYQNHYQLTFTMRGPGQINPGWHTSDTLDLNDVPDSCVTTPHLLQPYDVTYDPFLPLVVKMRNAIYKIPVTFYKLFELLKPTILTSNYMFLPFIPNSHHLLYLLYLSAWTLTTAFKNYYALIS